MTSLLSRIRQWLALLPGRSLSLIVIVALSVISLVWWLALNYPTPDDDTSQFQKSVFLRIDVPKDTRYKVKIEQTVDARSDSVADEVITIDVVDWASGASIPISQVELGQSQGAIDEGWSCFFADRSSLYPLVSPGAWPRIPVSDLKPEYSRETQRLGLDATHAPLIRAQALQAKTSNASDIRCTSENAVVKQRQARNVISPTQVLVNVTSAVGVLTSYEPIYSLRAPSDWQREGVTDIIESGGTKTQFSDTSITDVGYIQLPLSGMFIFEDPARRRLIDLSLSISLLFFGSLLATFLDWIVQRKPPRERRTQESANQTDQTCASAPFENRSRGKKVLGRWSALTAVAIALFGAYSARRRWPR